MINLDKEPLDKEDVVTEEVSNKTNIQAENTDTKDCVCKKGCAKGNMYTLHKSEKFRNRIYELKEEDFYPPEDTRAWRSGVMDIPHGDTFEEYFCWFYNAYDDIFDN